MPRLKAPTSLGLIYNSTKIAPGAVVDVLERDVKCLVAADWIPVPPMSLPSPVRSKKGESK